MPLATLIGVNRLASDGHGLIEGKRPRCEVCCGDHRVFGGGQGGRSVPSTVSRQLKVYKAYQLQAEPGARATGFAF